MNRWAKHALFFLSLLAMARGGFCAMKFNGSTDYIIYPNTFSSQPTAITLCEWVNISALPAAYASFIGRKVPSGNFQQVLIKSNGKLAFYLQPPVLNYDGTGTFTLVTNTWYFVAVTYDSVGGGNGYVNGQLDAHFAASGALGTVSAAFTVGASTDIAGRFFNGTVDDPRIYARALSQQELLTLTASRERYQNTDTFILYSPLDDGPINTTASAGTTVLDRSKNNLNGLTVGNPTWAPGILNYP